MSGLIVSDVDGLIVLSGTLCLQSNLESYGIEEKTMVCV